MTQSRPTIPLPIRLTAHDRLQVEIKSELLCPSLTEERATWSTDFWFILPQATGIAPGSYTPRDFYEDLRAYTRLKTPVVPLEELVRRDGLGSPLAPLTTLARRAAGSRLTRSEQHLLVQEAKLLSAVLKSQLRNWLAAQEGLADDVLVENTARLAHLLAEFMGNWRAIRSDLDSKAIPGPCRDVLSYADESLSIQLEQAALDQILLLPVNRRGDEGALALKALATEEHAHRESRGWRTTLEEGDRGREFVDQARLIKKYVSSALHLHLRTARWDWVARQGVPAFAAGLAMLWAVAAQLIMFLALDLDLQRGLSLGMLGTFSFLAVAAYVLKDRIKAVTVARLNRRLPALLSDRRDDVFLPDLDEPVGRISDRMTFQRSSSLPPEVQAMRTASARAHLLLVADQDVLHYRRQVELKPRLAATSFPRLDGLSDILRLNVWRWIRTYARARKQIPFVDDDGEVQVRKLDNLYFVDVLVRFQRVTPMPATHLAHLRLSLNRRGLVAVEEVGTVA
ncbi:MAG: hypothetical protein KDA24_26950 [Deltaproteobacteria bacterium]|nr:hypothetical protein [Deltaproteobacteria bacterium]